MSSAAEPPDIKKNLKHLYLHTVHYPEFKLTHKQVQNKAWMLGILIADHLQNGVEKKSFAKSKSYKPPAGTVRGRLVGIVAAYVWCQEHQ